MVRKKCALVVLVVLALLAMTGGAAVASHHEGGEKLAEMEKMLWEAWANNDAARFGKHLTDDNIMIVPSGVTIGKDENVAGIAAGLCDVKGYELGEITAHQVAEGVTILTYEATQDASCAGGRLPERIYASSVWVEKDGEWYNAMYHETAAALAAGPDPTEVDPDHYQVVLENEKVRVLRITYGPNEKSVMHYHPESVAVFSTDHAVRMTFPNGSTEVMEAKAGQVVWGPAGQHLPENLRDQSFEVIQVELKGGAGMPNEGG